MSQEQFHFKIRTTCYNKKMTVYYKCGYNVPMVNWCLSIMEACMLYVWPCLWLSSPWWQLYERV